MSEKSVCLIETVNLLVQLQHILFISEFLFVFKAVVKVYF